MNVNPRPCEGARSYTVRPGDTFYIIALEIGVQVDEIIRLNPGIDPENLQVGSVICVPLPPGIPTGYVPPCDSGFYWVIAVGDTLSSIAGQLGITVETLFELNPWIDPKNLLPGDSLCLPPQ